MFVPVCDRPSVAEPTEAQDRAVMETKSATIHRKMPMRARQLPITGSAHKAGVVGDAFVRTVLAALGMSAGSLTRSVCMPCDRLRDYQSRLPAEYRRFA